MAKAIRIVEKIIQPLGTRAIVLVKNRLVKIAVVKLAHVPEFVNELNPRETRRKIFVGVKECNLLFQLVQSP